MAHRSECGLPSAESQNCLVSPSSWESRPYPQSSLYIHYLVVPSPAVHSAYLLQCRSENHYLGMASSTIYCLISTSGLPWCSGWRPGLLHWQSEFDSRPIGCCIMVITEVGTLLTTTCYLTCTCVCQSCM